MASSNNSRISPTTPRRREAPCFARNWTAPSSWPRTTAPKFFVRLNSIVEYTDLLSGRTRKLSLVLPHEADIDQNRISVTTPVGAALLGLTPGQSFSWTTDDGRPHALVGLLGG
jgi:transcription elongation GreA/GreB family factor